MNYRVQLSSPAGKQLDRFDQVTARRLRDRLKELSLEPFSPQNFQASKNGARPAHFQGWELAHNLSGNRKCHEVRVDAFLPRDKAYP